MEALRIVGQPVPRKDARDIVTGNVVYSVDVSLPGMLYGRVVRSPIASGRILRIDVSKARAFPGVKAAITAQKATGSRFGLQLRGLSSSGPP